MAKPTVEKKNPETKVRNKATRLSAIADKLKAGAAPAEISEELAQVGNLCLGLAEGWAVDEGD
jgi:hypothetical protein